MPEWTWYALLLPAGFIAGIVNTIAGGGSFLTLPALMFVCGMEPKIANGTNRVAILLSSASAAATFHRHGHLDKKLALRLAIPTLLGVPFGALLAINLPADAFRPIFGVLFLTMALVLIINPGRLTEKSVLYPGAAKFVSPIFFGIGVYVGFIQAGMGMLLLMAMSLIRSGDLVGANAIKNLIGFFVTLIAMLFFVANGLVDWIPALIMAAGNAVGGVVGAKLAINKGNKLVVVFLVVVMIATGVQLLFFAVH
ncbi:MAG: sulfite exporter TauE/SafE family protein [Aureliella sp.]